MHNAMIHAFRALLATAAIIGMSFASASEPAAIVTDLRGEARLVGGSAIGLLAELPLGAEIMLERSARAVLVHIRSQSTYELAGPGSFAIRAGGVEGLAGSRPGAAKALSASFRDVRLRPAGIAQASIPMRGGSSDAELQLISPVATWLIEQKVQLRWESRAAAATYDVQLTDSENRVVFSGVSRASPIALPESVRLEPGRLYGWEVKASLPDGRVLEAWAEFGLADAALRSRVDAARPGPTASIADRIAFALLLEGLSVREAARDEWAQAARERPEDARLRALAEGR